MRVAAGSADLEAERAEVLLHPAFELLAVLQGAGWVESQITIFYSVTLRQVGPRGAGWFRCRSPDFGTDLRLDGIHQFWCL